jgi:hypothetical protein
LLRVEGEPAAYAPLVAAAAAEGQRIGWLELAGEPALPEPLAAALAAGLERAVAVGHGRTVAARRRRGPAVLRELLRQQFLGCVAVLVRGEASAPRLAVDGDRWRVEAAGSPPRDLDTAALVAALRQPRPFPPAEPIT